MLFNEAELAFKEFFKDTRLNMREKHFQTKDSHKIKIFLFTHQT